MSNFISDYLQTIIHPKRSLQNLLAKHNYFFLGFLYILIPIVAYTLLYIFLTMAHGAPSSFTPWLNISKENYYSVNRFLLAPSMILCWFVAASVIQVLSYCMNGKGSFEQTLAAIALSISIAMWGALIHDLPVSFLSAISVLDAKQHEIDMNSPTIFRTLLWICYSVYGIAFFILFPLAVRVVHQLSLAKSIITGIVAFIVFQLLFFVFNR